MDSVNVFKNYFGVFRDIIREMHSRKSLEDVLNLGVRKTAEVLQAKGAVVRLFDPSSQELAQRAVWGMDRCYFSNGSETRERLQRLSQEIGEIHFIPFKMQSAKC